MNILFALGSLLLGAALSLWPTLFRKLTTFFDTLIHEAGHGLASLPFGAPLPSITVRKNSSGETLSSMGYLHQLLPFGLGGITEKIARTISLMAGYSASIVLAALLIIIAPLSTVTFQPWHLILLAQVVLATILWTLVKITDSPWTFVFVAIAGTGVYIALMPWDWLIYGGIVVGMLLLFFIAKSWLSSIAVLLTLTSPLVPISRLLLGDNTPDFGISPTDLTIDTLWLSRIIFGALLLFLLACCRSLLSVGLTVLILGSIVGILFIPGVNHSYVLLAVAGILITAGCRSLLELHRITFDNSDSHWQQDQQSTDMVFASEEVGGDPRYWYWIQVTVTVASFLLIVGLGYSSSV